MNGERTPDNFKAYLSVTININVNINDLNVDGDINSTWSNKLRKDKAWGPKNDLFAYAFMMNRIKQVPSA